MSWYADAADVAAEVGLMGLEATEKLGEATPFAGIAVNGAKALYHGHESDEAAKEYDYDKADRYGNEAAYDWTKCIPLVGTVLGAGELAGGVANVVRGGEFTEGMDLMKDGIQDLGSMAGIKEFQHSPDDTFGSHTENRHNVDELDRLDEFAKKQEAEEAAGPPVVPPANPTQSCDPNGGAGGNVPYNPPAQSEGQTGIIGYYND